MADQPAARYLSLVELREQAQWLARDLAGPVRRVCVQSGDLVIEIEWQPHAGPPPPEPQLQPVIAPLVDQELDGHIVISSPMVGTVYRAPSPGAPPFVEVGDAVEPGQTVAIVEAMKLLNPIITESAGVVTEVLAVDGKPVQFDEPLFRLKTAGTATPADPAGGSVG